MQTHGVDRIPGISLVLLSGGYDSSLLLRMANEHSVALHIEYEHRAKDLEKQRCMDLCAKLGIDLFFLKTSTTFKTTENTIEMTGRNQLFCTMGSCLAKTLGIGTVLIGCCLDDFADYRDCRIDFIDAMNKVNKISGLPKIQAPLITMSKKRIKEEYSKYNLGTPQYCYFGKNCGECNSCKSNA